MRNFAILFVAILCLFSVFVHAGKKEDLQILISQHLLYVSISEIREFHEAFIPIWEYLKTELAVIAALPLNTPEQIKIATERYAPVQLLIAKIELIKNIDVITRGFNENMGEISKGELDAAMTKLATFKVETDKATTTFFGLIKIKLQLIGLVKQNHVSVLQYSVRYDLKAIEQGTTQLIAWWKENHKSEAGLKKIEAALNTVKGLESTAKSSDRKTLEMLQMQLTGLNYETIAIFIQEP